MEKVVLNNKIAIDEIAKYNELICQHDVKEIDITGFSIDIDEEEVIDYCCFDDKPALLLAKIYINKDLSTSFVIENGMVLSNDRHVLISFINNISHVIIPNTIQTIGRFAFSCSALKSIKIPESVIRIRDSAFYQCENLTEISLPDSVEELGEQSFANCRLERITLSNKLKAVPAGCFSNNDLDKVELPCSIKEIDSEAFSFNTIDKVIIPEGVEKIGWNVFDTLEYIFFPSTMSEIEKDFYYESQIDIPEDRLPYIEVNENNPIYFSKEGSLFRRDNPEIPYLGYSYKEIMEQKERKEAIIQFPCNQSNSQKEYTPEEILSQFPPYNCKPINEDASLFWIYEYGKGRFNIIDRYLNRYINENYTRDIPFSYNNFVLIAGIVYSIDLKEKLLEPFDGYNFEFCDKAGRIYVSKDIPVPKDKEYLMFSPFSEHLYYGCINLQKEVIIPCEYKKLGCFDDKGLAVAKKGNKFGIIDIHNHVVIPFEYGIFYRYFDEKGIAIVSKKVKGMSRYMFINWKNEILGTFIDQEFSLHKKEFHIYTHNGKYGYTRQFGYEYKGAIYQDIRVIDEMTIEVSHDGTNYEEIKY